MKNLYYVVQSLRWYVLEKLDTKEIPVVHPNKTGFGSLFREKYGKKISEEQIAFAASFNGTTVTNSSSNTPQPLENNHKEAYALLILHH